jgi:dihydrofolate reductase
VFVITHRPAETIVKRGGTSYIFVTEGPDEALKQARQAAGSQNVHVGGGAEIARYYLEAGAIDEFRLHIAPMLLGGGTRLFGEGQAARIRLRPTAAETEPLATHVTYAVERA